MHILQIFPQEESPLRLGCIMFFFNFCRVFVFLLLGGCAFIGSINSEPFYNYAYCADPSNGTSNASYESDLRVLLGSLSTKENYSFYNDSSNGIYGLFLCRGDVNSSTCQSCISYASQDITNRCSSNRTGIIWFDECLLRYSATNFFGQPQKLPYILMWNVNNQTSPDLPNYGARGLMNNLIGEALAKETFFSVGNAASPGNTSELIYGLVQCTLDLNSSACSTCLNQLLAIAEDCCQEKKGLRILAPSCSIRYENYPFFQQSPSEPVPVPPQQVPAAPPPLPGQGKRKNTTLIVGITVPSIAVVATLLGLWYYSFFGRRKRRELEKSQEILLQNLDTSSSPRFAGTSFHARDQENSGEMHYFSLSTIQTATNNFSDENKLGEGGFGPVYKGKLINGKEIAVKRLSMKSQQGLEEFKNEVMVIAKLQHRNLVRLLGYCLEEDEKLLVYEYMANTSLDVFLFDQTKRELLDWARRTNIINGIAKGLLYLHEDSRLKIIHRDLKTSNILLDDEINPKISDFGTARIFDNNQIKSNTSRVVGTYGYMAPEYAMEGLLSIKSDVYSFGVLMLEILSGKKNTGFYNSERAQSLLSLAWQLWNEGRGLELIDETLVHTCLEGEALRLIHIALSCVQEDPNDRPTMSLVVLMLGGNSIDLPQPKAPPFSAGRSTLTGLSSDTGTRTGFTSGLSSTSASAHSRD